MSGFLRPQSQDTGQPKTKSVDMSIDPKYLEFCETDGQKEKVGAWIELGSKRKAAKALGCSHNAVSQAYNIARRNAAKHGYSPEHDMTKSVPDGFMLKGTSTLYDDNGNQKLQWVKSTVDQERQAEIMRETIAALCEEIKPAPPIKAEKLSRNSDLLNQYTITDYHFGMKAWAEETGADWDLDIAEETLTKWFQQAIATSPNSENAIFAQIGDFLHWDGLDAVTPTHGHILDADTRFQKMVRVIIRTLRAVIAMLLKKHKHVTVLMAEGNHDLASSVWLREMLAALYENEPRITVNVSADVYYCHEFGQTSLYYHHGHKKKMGAIDTVFVAKFREIYGRTKYHYGHSGHLHHDIVNETNLMKLEQHRTLAAPTPTQAEAAG